MNWYQKKGPMLTLKYWPFFLLYRTQNIGEYSLASTIQYNEWNRAKVIPS